jgi:hypothetical protein
MRVPGAVVSGAESSGVHETSGGVLMETDSEPGLSVSIRHATDFFIEHLGETDAEKVQGESRRTQR